MVHACKMRFALMALALAALVSSQGAQAAVVAEVGPAPQGAAPCCPPPCIEYHSHRPLKKICCGCEAPITVMLMVKDPCNCCTYEVPVCAPACCTQPPCVETHCGLFGRTIVEYEWCCGYRVKVIINRCGDLDVHTYGH